MPVTIHWHDESKTILRMPITDPWTLAEMNAAAVQSRQMMATVDHKVVLIMDALETNGFPKNVFSHFATNTKESDLPINQEAVIVVVRGALLQAFVSTAKRILPHLTRRMHMADSLAAAEAKIAALRHTQP
jgi:hypothetical protein